jgi:hypothetical protein
MKPRRGILFYVAYVTAWTAVIVVAGALVGAVSFPLVGAFAGLPRSAAGLALSGARQLAFLAFVWAPGIAIVMAFHHAWRSRQSSGTSPPGERPGPSSS